MAKNTLGGYIVSNSDPIDSRIVFNTVADAITGLSPSLGGRPCYVGLMVFITGENKIYYVESKSGADVDTLTEYSSGTTSLSDLSLDGDLTTFSVPSNTTISTFGKSLVDDTNASTARTTLGLTIGTNVQAFNQNLADIAGLATTDNNFIVGNGSNFTLENASTARTSLGVDAAGTVNYSHPTHPGDDIDIDTGALTGATVISDLDFNITTDTEGHVTDANGSISTRNLTLSDLGFTGATDANNYSLPATHTSITSIKNDSLVIGGNSQNNIIKFDTDDQINLQIDNSTKLQVESNGINVTGHITASGNITASSAIFTGNVDAETFSLGGATFISTETLVRSGSTIFSGSINITTHQFTGSVLISGSLSLPGILNVSESIRSIKASVDAGSPFSPTSISGSWQGYITGSNIISSSTQIATEISNSWGGYITGSGILSSSTQIATEIS